MEELLTALFYPALTSPRVEYPIHEGRKRIDITYTNNARQGFFDWLRLHSIPCRYITVECKNFQSDPADPELDQLSSRFSPLRGQVGLLVCRTFNSRELLMKRCRDTTRHGTRDHRTRPESPRLPHSRRPRLTSIHRRVGSPVSGPGRGGGSRSA